MTHGPAYSEKLDGKRLTRQRDRVLFLMLGRASWLTLREMCEMLERAHGCNFPESSVSADLRHLRKAQFGGYDVQKRRRGEGSQGIWEYVVRIPLYEWQQASFESAVPSTDVL